jgi:restriction system protein
MAKKKTSPIEDLLDLTSLLPWWACLGLAIAAYVFLHNIASSEVAAPVKAAQMGEYAARHVYKGVALVALFVLPAILLAGVAASIWRRSKRRQLMANITQSPSANALDGMTWQEFEILIDEAFRQQGFAVTETGGGGADGGVDLVLAKNGEKFLVQCK